MRQAETNQSARILAAISKAQIGVKLMRNNNGVAFYLTKQQIEILRKFGDGPLRRLVYGLGVGTSDFIGWRKVLITQEMVGTWIAQFVGMEDKVGNRTESDEQRIFRMLVNDSGGLAFVARSEEEALQNLRGESLGY